MAGNITVGILRALLTLDTAQFHAGLREAGGSAKAFQSQMRAIGGNLSQLGSTLTASVTLPIVAVFGAATKAAIDFESSFAGVRKTVSGTEADFVEISKQFRMMSREMPISVHELNRLGETAGALGIPKQSIVDFTKVMAELGVTTNVTSDQAAESIAKIQNIFGASGKFTEQFASTLVDLGNKGASSEADILALATRIASAGNTVNMTQSQVLGFAAAIANVGMEAEAGGSAFSRVVLGISEAVSAGGADLARFAQVAGMSSAQFAALFKTNAAGAVQAFVEGLGRIKQGGGDLNAVLGQLGFTEIRQSDLLRRLAGDSTGVATALGLANTAWTQNTALSEEAGKRFGTFQSQLTTFWGRLTDIGITLGTALMPALTAFLGILNAIMPAIEFLAQSFAAMPVPMQMMAVGAAALVAAAGPLLLFLSQIAMGLAALTGLGGFAGLMTAMSTVATFITGGLTAAFTAILPWLGPVGLIALGVGAVVLAWKYWDEIVAFFSGAWQIVKQALMSTPDLLLPLLGPIGLVVAAFKHWDQIKTIAAAVYTAVKEWLVDKFAAVVKWIGEKVGQVTGFFKNMYTAVVGQSYVPDMITGIGDEFARLDGVMVDPAKRSTTLVQGLFKTMADSVEGIVSTLSTKLSTKIDELLGKLTSKLTGWLDSFMPAWAAKFVGGLASDVLGGLSKRFLGDGALGRGLLGKIPGLSGLFGSAGAGVSGALGSGAAINATTSSLAAGGGAGAGAGGGAGMGFLTNPAFWTNPFTIAGIAGAALGLGIWKGGLFRGGQEALKVSPRRDQFFSQFGDVQNRGEGGAAWNLASKLVALGQGDGGGPLFAALQKADTVSKWETAQASVVALLKRTGMEVHSFAQGGFIPPGVVTPAILHGGASGEIVAPLEKMGGSVINFNSTIIAWDGADVRRAMPTLIRELKLAMLMNQDGLVTAQRRALEA